jgi:cysteine synthase B
MTLVIFKYNAVVFQQKSMKTLQNSDISIKVGNTPLFELKSYSKPGLKLAAKLEFTNPFGSLKDRAAVWMVGDAIRKGLLGDKNRILIEPTSGNTGVALAGVAAKLGMKAVFVVPQAASEETKERIRGLGAEVMETPDDLCPRVGRGTDQAISLAESIVKSLPHVYYMPNQYLNEANFMAHYESTGPEIWEQTRGAVTHFVAGIGTGGTLTGVGEYLKSRNPLIKIVGVQPQKNHRVQGLRNLEESAKPELLKRRERVVDEWVTVSDEASFEAVRELAEKCEILVGPSSGAVLAGLEKLNIEKGNAVVIFGDNGEKYQKLYTGTNLFSEAEYKEFRRRTEEKCLRQLK